MNKNKYVVTITRQFGSLGRPIAQSMSEKLGVEFYDRDLVDQAAKKLKLPYSTVEEEEEAAEIDNPFGKGTNDVQDRIFEAQQNIIRFLAEKESCIIVGRCSDFILSEVENSMHIFIYAPYEKRVENCVKSLGMEEDEARRMILAVDEARDAYHLQYAGYKPDDKNHKHILIDSSLLGTEGTADYLAELVKKRFGE